MKILFLSHTFYGGLYRVGSHELSEVAISKGHNVLHVSTPISPFHYLLKFIIGQGESSRFDQKKIVTWSRVPFVLFPVQLKLSKWLPGKVLKTILKNDYDLVLVDQPYFLRFVSRLKAETKIVLRLTDVISDKRQRSLIHNNLSRVAGIAVTNEFILEKLEIPRKDTIVVPNGVNRNFANVKKNELFQRGMIYIGSLDERIDWEFIENLSLSTGFEYLHLFGSGNIPTKLPNGVTFMGPIDFEKSVSVMATYKFLVLPYKDNDSNRGRSPMKLHNAIRLGLIPLVPDWMRQHEQLIGKTHILMSEITSMQKSLVKIDSIDRTTKPITWDINFEILVKWAMNLPQVSNNAK